MASRFIAYVDESSSLRGDSHQEYMVCAAVIEECHVVHTRNVLRPLLLPGQIKLHWSDERPSRHRKIVDVLAQLDSMLLVVTHRSTRTKKTERFRRKCLENLYFELSGLRVRNVILESRQKSQDTKDIEHIVALQGRGLADGIRLSHARGGDDPLLWIPDAVLGSLNSYHRGRTEYWEKLQDKVVLHEATSDSL
ncbi:hypothetical protein [Dietzia timorensis]|uniref:hypothetical protein n=1 Tax=Dietzia timorensis TaxID=499555 RepID=UPI001E324212|nr:hypothetical protein [Dietzia timorensis]